MEVFEIIMGLVGSLFGVAILVIPVLLIIWQIKFMRNVPVILERIAESNERTAIALERTAGALERKEHREIMDRNAARQASKQNTAPQNQSQQ